MNFSKDRWKKAVAPVLAGAAALVFGSLAASPAGAQKFPDFPDPRLKQGRAIWLGTCEACHANDVAGAPLVTSKAAWAPRLAKGREALYKSALGGLTGPKGTQMPPRGGNDKLRSTTWRLSYNKSQGGNDICKPWHGPRASS
jgi:cytochrome c5